MKNSELIRALQMLDPDATVLINIKQYNKNYGKQVGIEDSLISRGISQYEIIIDQGYSGATIHIHLPGKARIVNWPKD